MAVTRKTALQRVADELQWPYGNISSGTATTAVLGGLVGAYEDDEFNSDRLLMPDAATAADQERIITDWAGSTGTATIATRADTDFDSETFILVPGAEHTLSDLRNAVNACLRRTKRTVKYVIPTVQKETVYSLQALDWLRSRADVDAVRIRNSPNLLDNEDFQKWQNGASSAPDSWTLAGTDATVARATTWTVHASSGYSVTVTRVGNDATLTIDVPYSVAHQLIADAALIKAGGWVQSATASVARIGINNGVDTTWSDYHSGDGEPEWLTAERTLTAAASRVRYVFSVDTSNASGTLAFAALCEENIPDLLKDAGSTAFTERSITNSPQNIGSTQPSIQLAGAVGRRQQLVVWTRRPYATLSADSDSTDCPEDVVLNGTLFHLFSSRKLGQDRERPDANARDYSTAYRTLAAGLIEKPVPEPMTQHSVHGA